MSLSVGPSRRSYLLNQECEYRTAVPHNRLVQDTCLAVKQARARIVYSRGGRESNLNNTSKCTKRFNLAGVTLLFGAADGDVPYRPTAEAADAGQVEEDEDDDAIAARRARIRERLRARPTEEAEVLEVEQEDIAK